ncbi:hypothetical protein T4D_10119 [Trichinella pseudospiralis]|uniref:Uncharacterized protein n=1 Tax=Trichinella pseudospiralis TaxID=6337 RepID=A0A0V1FI51_TRIPS|nr:hypothetical protein T4D_10119 [Trichinella pseudospiralis]
MKSVLFVFHMLRLDTLRGVLTKSIFCYGVFCPIVQSTKNRFLTLHYANNDRHKGAFLSIKVHLFI